MIFVDTSAWYAKTDYIVDETLTLLRSHKQSRVALRLGQQLFEGTFGRLYYLTPEDLAEAWESFRQFDDKEWSFTDCTSKVVIERLRIGQAFSFDHHFSQFGTVNTVP